MHSQRVINNHLQAITKNEQSMDKDSWLKEYGYYVVPHPDKRDTWFALLVGPDETEYSGAFLLLRITFPEKYPIAPPIIENMCRLTTKFSENLWSVDQKQQLLCSDDQYRDFYGLLCLDVLNTPHSEVVASGYGQMQEIYDKTKEKYSPVMGIGSILLATRSMVMTKETKLAHLDVASLKYLVSVNLTIGFSTSILKPETKDFREFIVYKPGEREVIQKYKDIVSYVVKKNKTVYQNLLESSDINVRLSESERQQLQDLISLE